MHASDSAPSPVGEPPAQASQLPPAVAFDQPTVISKNPPQPSSGSAGSAPRFELGVSLVGQRLDHFELQAFVGGGGMGAVFRAVDTRLNRLVALKVLSREQSADEEAVRRFKNEAQSAARCDHDNIARVYHIGEDQGLHYIAFEFIEGNNIRDIVERAGPLPIGDVVSYTLQVAEALAHASRRNVVHRDIKPSNIIVTASGKAKLVDMGLARLAPLKASQDDLTASGVTLGTFDYISPEQARDPRTVDVRSDIYSLGCTVYYMLTGRPPFPEGTVLQKLLQHQGDAPPDPREFNPDLPDGLTRVVSKMMAKDPRRRYQTPEELIHDLLLLANQLGIVLPQPATWAWEAPIVRSPSRLERHLPWIVPVVSLLLVVLVLHFNSGSVDEADREPPDRNVRGIARVEVDGASDSNTATTVGSSVRDTPHKTPATATAPPSEPIAPTPRGLGVNSGPSNDRIHSGHSASAASSQITASQMRSATAAPQQTSASTKQEASSPPSISGESRRDLPNPVDARDENALPDKQPGATATRTELEVSRASSEPSPSMQSGEKTRPQPASLGQSVTPSESDRLSTARLAAGISSDGTSISGGIPSATDLDTGAPRSPAASSNARAPQNPASSTASASNDLSAGGLQGKESVVLVSREGTQIVGFNTLRAACAAARDGDAIELRYTGRRVEEPLDISNIELTIRAAEGFNPTIVFHADRLDPLDGRHAMVIVAGGQLQLIDVDLDFDIAREATAESWSLFEMRHAEQLRLQRCWLTIRNASDQLVSYHPDVSFVETSGLAAANGMPSAGRSPDEAAQSEIVMEQCVVRGEATLLRCRHPVPLRFSWNNGLLATPERMIVSDSSPIANTEQPAQLDLMLRHVTLAARHGVALFSNSRDAPYVTHAKVQITDSILQPDDTAPLFEHVGVSSVEDFRRALSWQIDHVYALDGRPTFWKIRGLTSQGLPEVETFPSWKTFLRGELVGLPRFGSVVWKKLPSPDMAFHEHSPDDYVLDETSSDRHTAYRGASDGRDAGFDATLLPTTPSSIELTTRDEPRSPRNPSEQHRTFSGNGSPATE